MATWSRSQSQDMGAIRGASSGIKVKCSTDLQRNERIMQANKRENKRIIRWAEEAPTYKKVRNYDHAIEVKLSRKASRALNGRVLSTAKRLKLQEKAVARRAFFAELGVSV